MAKKKRIDSERDPSSAKRVLKLGGAVLAASAGAALFSRSGLMKQANRILPAIMDTNKTFRRELLGKKGTAMDYYNAYNKAIGPKGSQFMKTVAEQGKKGYDFSTARVTNVPGLLKNIKQTSNVGMVQQLNKKNMSDILEGALESVTEKYKDKYSNKAINQVVKETLAKYKEVSDEKGNVSIDFLKRTKEIEGYNITDDDLRDMVGRVSAAAREGTSSERRRKLAKDSLTLSDEVREKQLEALKKKTRDNKLINKIGKKLKLGNLDDLILGSHQATIGEVLDNLDKLGIDPDDFAETIKNSIKAEGREHAHMINSIKDVMELRAKGGFDDVIFDKNLRVRNTKDGLEFLDLTRTNEFFEQLGDSFDSTIIGRVLTKGIDRKGTRNAPKAYILQAGKKSTMAFLDGADDQILKESKIVVDDTIYELLHDDKGYHIGQELGKGVSINMMHGSFSTVLKNMLGSERIDPMDSSNALFKKLDIGQTGRPNIFNRIEQWFHKFENPDWERNEINRTIDVLFDDVELQDKIDALAESMETDRIEVMARLYEDFKDIDDIFKRKASHIVLDDDTVAQLQSLTSSMMDSNYYGDNAVLQDKLTKVDSLLNLVLKQDRPEDLFDELLELQSNGLIIKSNKLSNLLDRYQANAVETLNLISIESSSTKKIPILDMEISETNVKNVSGILKQEILKEITEEKEIADTLQATLTDSNWEAFELLRQWQSWQSTISVPEGDNLFTAIFTPGGRMERYLKELHDDPASMSSMATFLTDFKRDYGVLHKGSFKGYHESYNFEYNTYDFIPKSNLGVDMIKELNSWTKIKSIGKEFIAGRDDLEHVTPATLVTQYMINRLSMGVEEAGLGFSYRSLGSPLDTIKNIMTKRVLPAMLAYTAFDYLNDLSQDVTGVGITGAMANVVANADVLGRGIAYKTGIGQALDWFKRTSVIAEYWTGSTDFQTADERKEWYKEGYSPVRKSRFWGFGSSSEFRGGDISFFQPNYLRRIHSDYKDKVIYGSNKEKWAHSIIPTPTHPLSTIRYLMDPYWLERKHIDDAPTPLTGKMFSEGSFWGAILNPTVGEVIKPQIMLPEIKKRLTGKGHDVKGIVRKINERIKRKASEYDDMLIVNGTDIRNATYIPYGNATPGTITVTPGGQIRGMDYMESVQDLKMYRTPDGTTYTQRSGGGYGLPVTYRMEDHGPVRNTIDEIVNEFSTTTGVSKNIVQELNNAIKNRQKHQRGRGRQGGPSYASQAPDSTNEGTFIYNNLVNEYNNYLDTFYSDRLDPNMLNTNKYGDYLHDAKHSIKNLSGIYGFIGEQFFGEDSFTLRYENAGSYSSFARGFWDAGLGGLGGGTMEIARRFFPSSDKSRIDYNPLVNNMPEWLPDKFHYGVPWTKVTKGEMRLPGKGYEALNELHPDEFADENGYGSFDKFKILADVAPNSNEYKIWHNIVKNTIKDPELKAEIKKIEARTKRMSGSHEFYEYQYLHTGTEYERGVVKTINDDGTVVLANNQILTLAGIEFNDNYGGELHNFIKPGQEITYRVEKDVVNDPTGEGVIRRAAIYQKKFGDTINKQLMDMGVADRDAKDTSAIGNLAIVSSTQETWGAVQELIAHARIPILHNKLMHIETPLESFISEQVYGANFQTWDHPIETHVKPMLNEVAGQNAFQRLLARSYRSFHFNKVLSKADTTLTNKALKFGSGAVMATLDPAAMLGGTIGLMLRLNNGRHGEGRQKLGAFSRGAEIGGKVGDLVYAWAQADDPLSAAIAFGSLAGEAYKKLELGEFAEKVLKKSLDMKGAIAIGAGIGLGISAIKNADWDKERLFGKWTPKKYKKINEVNEYFDRLEYIKYKGLYEAASRKAALIEGTDVKGIFRDIDRNKKKIAKLKREAEKLLDKFDEGDSEYKVKMAEIQRKISSLQETGNNVFKGGKYTKSAVAYKKAMESTIYGLSESSTKDEILAAIPDQYKDYFQKFINVRDKSEQKKILKYMPEYLKRPLQLAWGQKLSDVDSNRKYFKTHKLPGVGWRGWKPNINLKHVKMKTIQNEGMILSDFGFYESEKGKASYTVAPDIEEYDKGNGGLSMFTSIRLMAEMKGLGLGLTNVSIDRTTTPGMWISADIKQSISDRTEIASNSMTNAFQALAANFF